MQLELFSGDGLVESLFDRIISFEIKLYWYLHQYSVFLLVFIEFACVWGNLRSVNLLDL